VIVVCHVLWVPIEQILLEFCLIFKRRYGPRRSNLIGENDGLEQKKQIKVEQISRLSDQSTIQSPEKIQRRASQLSTNIF